MKDDEIIEQLSVWFAAQLRHDPRYIGDPASLMGVPITDLTKVLRLAGMKIIRKPERKPRPDAPGWWWVKLRTHYAPVVCNVTGVEGELWGQWLGDEGQYLIENETNIEWAIGLLPVPEEEG